jgi:importin subunit beta-1
MILICCLLQFLTAIQSQIPVVCHTAAQVLAAYGAVDLPRNEWPGLLPALFANISGQLHDTTKVASLEALGYLCDSMEPEEVVPETVNHILNVIVVGMAATNNPEIRLAAATALNNSLAFTDKNFAKDAERNAIMQAICEATQCQQVKVRERAFECFATIADLYYQYLGPYAVTLFNLSVAVIRTDDPMVGMQAIELWNTICDQELNILQDIEDGEDQESSYLRLTEQAAPALTPLLLECMTKQEDEDAEDDNWSIAKASAALLETMAQTIHDKIVDLVLPFISANFMHSDWHLKEASIMAFGVILDGPSEMKLSPIVVQALPSLIASLKDTIPLVRDSSAWTIGRICELHKQCISGEILPSMMDGIGNALDDKSGSVVSQACYAVIKLAEACEDESEATSNVLSHFMPVMVTKLMQLTAKNDFENDHNIKSDAYEAVNRMIANSALDMQDIVIRLLEEALTRLQATFQMSMDHNARVNTQSSLCSLVGEVVKKIHIAILSKYCDKIVELLLAVLNTKAATAHEDAFLVMGYLSEKLGAELKRYIHVLIPAVQAGLQSKDEYQVVTVAVGTVGDMARALGKEILPHCDALITNMLELLKSSTIHRSVKPHVISLFADIAMAIEGDFERYSGVIMPILRQAGEVKIESEDEELIEYINTLRNSILEAYSGIVQGLSSAGKEDVIIMFLESISEFLRFSAQDPNRSGEVLKSAVGLLGDLGQIYKSKSFALFKQPFVSQLINEAIQNGSDAQEVGQWTQSVS